MTALAGLTLGWPSRGRAQGSSVPLIGFLASASPEAFGLFVGGFRQGLKEAGFVEGENAIIEFRWARGRYEELPSMAEELVRRHASVLLAAGGNVTAKAATTASSTIPIVFVSGDDPLKDGLVASLSRPGGNVTGISLSLAALTAKKLELIFEIAPKAELVGLLMYPGPQGIPLDAKSAEAAVQARGGRAVVLYASTEAEIDSAFATLAERQVKALFVSNAPFFLVRRDQVVGLAARYRVPTVYPVREYVTAGGLMSYGPNLVDGFREAGLYTGKILRGTSPADLPVQQPSTFELVINATTAITLGLTIPQTLLVRADEVIE